MGHMCFDVCGEKLSTNLGAVDVFTTELIKFINKREHKPEQIYNVDEMGLYFRLLYKKKMFATADEKSMPGTKVKK